MFNVVAYKFWNVFGHLVSGGKDLPLHFSKIQWFNIIFTVQTVELWYSLPNLFTA